SLGGFDDSNPASIGNALVLDSGGRPVIVGATFSPLPAFKATAGIARLAYDLVYTNDFEVVPRGCLSSECN
ncbi:MAG TPA: hypothetical protein VFI49_13185, partial [Rudaea sp.]|nr:hypothetical protein [Rudaea sp.]